MGKKKMGKMDIKEDTWFFLALHQISITGDEREPTEVVPIPRARDNLHKLQKNPEISFIIVKSYACVQ